MKYTKTVNRESLTPEELEALDNGDKTEEDLISEWEAKEAEEREKIVEEAKKAKELAENYKVRAEKAEAKAKEGKDTPKTDSLSQKDLVALIRAEVHEDDFDEVIDYAKLKNIEVADALKSSVIRTILSEKKEERASAQATSTGNKGAGTKAPSGSELLSRAQKTGELPDDEEGLKKLINAEFKK
ncbi:MAG: hypothetical protein WDA47_05800 [Bacilli bacterium]|jgi:hypothetical protein